MSLPTVLFIINSMSGGGAERVLSRLLSLSERQSAKYHVHLAILDRDEIVYPIPPWVKVHQLNSRGGFLRALLQVRRLDGEIHPKLRVSFLTRANVVNCLIPRRRGTRRIISERINTSMHFAPSAKAQLMRKVVRLTYPLADRVIAVSGGIADDLVKNFGVRRESVCVIPNPVDIAAIRREAATLPVAELPPSFVFSMGRLHVSKNHSLLLRAFARADVPGALVIAGEGPDRDKLKELACTLGIGDRTIFLGFQANPYSVLARANMFVLPSNVEGFPNALVEAMAVGVPVIATNCPDGPAEILARKSIAEVRGLQVAESGILVPLNDVEELIAGMRLMQDPATRADCLEGARRRLQDFDPEKVVGRYWSVFRREMQLASETVG